jgi:hypothetical protein
LQTFQTGEAVPECPIAVDFQGILDPGEPRSSVIPRATNRSDQVNSSSKHDYRKELDAIAVCAGELVTRIEYPDGFGVSTESITKSARDMDKKAFTNI